RLKSRIENELCQKKHECRQTHHRLLHVEAESERTRRQQGWPSQPSRLTGRGRARRTAEQRRANTCRQVCQRWWQRRGRVGSMALMQTAAGEPQHQW
ncbi:MAG: hypothetical protein ACK56F_20910, partial [bacterium]